MSGEPVYLSATQIDNARLCLRKWAWDKIARIPRPANRSLDLGSRVHDILEGFFKDGTAPDFKEKWRFKSGDQLFYTGEIAASMIPTLAPLNLQNYDIKTEMLFEIDSILPGIVLVGKIDIHYVTDTGERFAIIDHKTSSDPKQWGKKLGELTEDTQRILYSRVGYEMYPKSLLSDFSLNYGSVKLQKNKNHLVTIPSTRKVLVPQFEKSIAPIAMQMADLKRLEVHPLELPPSPGACGAFGGCPYKTNCNLSNKERLSAFMSGKSKVAELLARSKAKQLNRGSEVEEPVDKLNPPEAEEEKSQGLGDRLANEAKDRETTRAGSAAAKLLESTKAEKPPKVVRAAKSKTVPGPTDEILIGFLAGLAIGANPETKDTVFAAVFKTTGKEL